MGIKQVLCALQNTKPAAKAGFVRYVTTLRGARHQPGNPEAFSTKMLGNHITFEGGTIV